MTDKGPRVIKLRCFRVYFDDKKFKFYKLIGKTREYINNPKFVPKDKTQINPIYHRLNTIVQKSNKRIKVLFSVKKPSKKFKKLSAEKIKLSPSKSKTQIKNNLIKLSRGIKDDISKGQFLTSSIQTRYVKDMSREMNRVNNTIVAAEKLSHQDKAFYLRIIKQVIPDTVTIARLTKLIRFDTLNELSKELLIAINAQMNKVEAEAKAKDDANEAIIARISTELEALRNDYPKELAKLKDNIDIITEENKELSNALSDAEDAKKLSDEEQQKLLDDIPGDYKTIEDYTADMNKKLDANEAKLSELSTDYVNANVKFYYIRSLLIAYYSTLAASKYPGLTKLPETKRNLLQLANVLYSIIDSNVLLQVKPHNGYVNIPDVKLSLSQLNRIISLHNDYAPGDKNPYESLSNFNIKKGSGEKDAADDINDIGEIEEKKNPENIEDNREGIDDTRLGQVRQEIRRLREEALDLTDELHRLESNIHRREKYIMEHKNEDHADDIADNITDENKIVELYDTIEAIRVRIKRLSKIRNDLRDNVAGAGDDLNDDDFKPHENKAMTNINIIDTTKKSKIFRGVLMRDQFTDLMMKLDKGNVKLPLPSAYIINTDVNKNDQSGQHWILYYTNNQWSGIVDPGGLKAITPYSDIVKAAMSVLAKQVNTSLKLKFNKNALQTTKDASCGYACIVAMDILESTNGDFKAATGFYRSPKNTIKLFKEI